MRTTIYFNKKEEEKLAQICGETPISTCVKKLALEKMKTADTDIQVKLYAILEVIKEIDEKVERLEQKINNLH